MTIEEQVAQVVHAAKLYEAGDLEAACLMLHLNVNEVATVHAIVDHLGLLNPARAAAHLPPAAHVVGQLLEAA